MEKFDGLLYGNGLTLSLFSLLKPLIRAEKSYLLYIDDFMKAFIHKQLSIKEEERIFGLLYKSKDITNIKNFEQVRDRFTEYYNIHNANIEYWLGVDLFTKENCKYEYDIIETLFPVFYNIWHDILIDYFSYLRLNEKIHIFEKSVSSILDEKSIIFTTNFDNFTQGLKPQHLHGTFVKNYKKINDINFANKDDKSFYFKCLWGWNGVGKLNLINEIKCIAGYEKYFDFDFFFSQNFSIENLLIYGIGFQKSGYMREVSISFPEYQQPTIGGIIDEHIILRLKGLQTQRQLNNITFAYYADSDLQHYKYLEKYFALKNVNYIKSNEFSFY